VRFIEFTNKPLPVVLRIYSELTGLTLLQHPDLGPQKVTITSTASNQLARASAFATALTNAGIVSITDREKFLRLLPAELAEQIQRVAIPLRGTNEAGSTDKLPAKVIHLVGIKVEHAARI
jgi:hypothetical protein